MKNKRPRLIRGHDLEELRRKLEHHRQELTQQMVANLRDVRAEGGTQRHSSIKEDHGQVEARDDSVATIIEMKSETLIKIERALRLLEQGRYGACTSCGGQIADNRLRALPFALRCTPCEEAHERQAQTLRRARMLRGNGADFQNS